MPVARTCQKCGEAFTCKPSDIVHRGALFCSPRCSGNGRVVRSLADRFWPKVNKDGPIPEQCPDLGPCWLWQGAKNNRGYPQIRSEEGKAILAHRVAWGFATDQPPTPKDLIGHVCDTPPCVRNDSEGFYIVNGIELPRRGHLFIGDDSANVRDMLSKGRANLTSRARGEAHGLAKTTDAAVLAMRAAFDTGTASVEELALTHGLTRQYVKMIVTRRGWTHLP